MKFIRRIEEKSDVGEVGYDLPQQLQPFAFKVRREPAQPSDVATGPRQVRHDAAADRIFLHNRQRMMDFATEHRLPSVNAYRELVEAGGLASYGPSYEEMHRRAADYVDRILKGARPGDLPIEQPTRFTLVVNLKAAKALGLEVPPTLVARADEVIE